MMKRFFSLVTLALALFLAPHLAVAGYNIVQKDDGSTCFRNSGDSTDTFCLDASNNVDVTGTLQLNAASVTATASEINTQADLSANGGLVKVRKISITATPDGTEQDTAWDLPAKSVVLGVWVDVTTAEATGTTKTLDVGLKSGESGGDADGFLDGVSVASQGVVKGTLASGGQTLGAFLRVDEGGTGELVPEPAVTPTAVSVTYTAGANDFAEFRGDIYIVYMEIG
jgi:hypothetical protein